MRFQYGPLPIKDKSRNPIIFISSLSALRSWSWTLFTAPTNSWDKSFSAKIPKGPIRSFLKAREGFIRPKLRHFPEEFEEFSSKSEKDRGSKVSTIRGITADILCLRCGKTCSMTAMRADTNGAAKDVPSISDLSPNKILLPGAAKWTDPEP